MRVLSLFDGMACGMLAFQAAGINVSRYVAFEIDSYAVKTSSHNFPMIEHRGDVFKADFTEFSGFDFVIGGSPCTFWSIAQKNNRETEASGMGWELFSQFVRAIKEVKPMFFVYENNKSMSKAIRESITQTFGFEPICINSALVSAQNRQRLYWVGKRNPDGTYSRVHVDQPEDRGILLRDVLDGMTDREKGRCVLSSCGSPTTREYFEKNQGTMAFEPLKELTEREMEYMVREIKGGRNHFDFGYIQDGTKDKGACLTANVSKGVPYNVCCVPVRIPEYGIEDKARPLGANYSNNCGGFEHRMFSEKPNKQQVDMVATPVRVGLYPNENGVAEDHQQNRVYSIDGKSINLCGNGGGMGAKTGLYAVPLNVTDDGKSQTLKAQYHFTSIPNICCYCSTFGATGVAVPTDQLPSPQFTGEGKDRDAMKRVYEVKDGMITIKGKQYPIKLADGYYIIRKLTVSECKRLQTVPEWYAFPVSDTQAYKMLGNGWTVEVIAHLLNATQAGIQAEEQLSLFGNGVI